MRDKGASRTSAGRYLGGATTRGAARRHALVHEGRVWLVDPFDDPEAMERVAALGEPAGVLQLFVAHNRDGEAIAKRLGVPFHKLPGRAAATRRSRC